MERHEKRQQVILGHLAPGTAPSKLENSQSGLVGTKSSSGVAVITINNPPVNSLSPAVMQELSKAVQAAKYDDAVRAIVITGANKSFVAGADISHFQYVQSRPETAGEFREYIQKGNKILCEIEECGKPAVAAIQGVALGGGLELAMSCSARVAAPKSSLGLVELKLGIIPGLGGTQRLPRIVGVKKAAEMMLLSQTVKAEEAHRLGLVDEVTPECPVERAIAFAQELADGKRERANWLQRSDRLGPVEVARQIVNMARKEAAKKSANVPHPAACLDAILYGVENGGLAGLSKETDLFTELVYSETAMALVHIFFAQRACAKVPGITDLGLKPRAMKSVAVLGGGLMGSGIATALILSGVRVVLKEVNEKFLAAGIQRIQNNVAGRLKQGKISQAQFDSIVARLFGQIDYAGFDKLDMVIEAAIEKIDLKQAIFAELEQVCSKACILATNTSTIDIEVVGAKTRSQDRILGVHFFSPAHIMPLVEIVRTRYTSSEALVDSLAVCRAMGKTAIVVGNCTGFAVNRIFFPYNMAAVFLADRGVDPYRIDRALMKFGMPMGAFRLGDLVGIDVCNFVNGNFEAAYSDRTYHSALPALLTAAGRLGEKTGAGYYKHVNRKAEEDPAVLTFLEQSRRDAGSPPALDVSDEEIVQMILFPVINEACCVLDEGVVTRPSDIDIASVFGMGFPAYRGGVMQWGQTVGSHVVYSKLLSWSQRFNAPLFAPSAFLAHSAMTGRPVTSLEPIPPTDGGAPDDICVVSALRTAVTRAKRGLFKDTGIDDMLAAVVKQTLAYGSQYGVQPADIGDLTVGLVLPKSDQGALHVRVASLLAGLPNTVPCRTVNRLCSSGLQAIADVAAAITSGHYEIGLAGGVESMSQEGMSFDAGKINLRATGEVKDCYLNMGQTSENVARRYGITRRQQDELAAQSHARAGQAIRSGKFKGEIVPVETTVVDPKTKQSVKVVVSTDEGVREETTVESLGKLRPVFAKDGTTTAGNSSQLSDGASLVMLMKRSTADRLRMPVLAVIRSFAVVGVEPSVMGIGPAVAIPAAVAKAGLKTDEIDLYEINEAFASQATYSMDTLGLDRSRVNVNGGAIALGHPLGNTGSKLTVSLIHEMARRHTRYGVVSMCIGTGMGAAAVFERTAHP